MLSGEKEKIIYLSRFHYIHVAPIEILEVDPSVTESEMEERLLTDIFEARMSLITPVDCICNLGDKCYCNY